MSYYIPEIMKQYNNWVVWRKVGKQKPPYDPRELHKTKPEDIDKVRRANATKPCCSFDYAESYYNYSGICDGIGFVFTKECGLTFIDLDNCIDEDGNESPLAQEMQDLFADCYIELSQSERGLHIVCIGSVPRSIKTKEIEIYSSGQYMAMTGNATRPQEPQRAQERLDIIFNRYKTKTVEIKPQNAPQGHIYSQATNTQELIELICNSRQGEKWARIHAGNYDGYSSPSEAVQAYINIVNYFSGGNIDLIKALFYQSQFPKINPKYKKGKTGDYYIELATSKAQATATGTTNTKRRKTKVIEVFEEPLRGRRRVIR